MKKTLLILLTALLFLGAVFFPAQAVFGDTAVPLNISAKEAFIMEYETGKVLFEKDATKARPIASMIKIMTLNIIYDAVKEGKISLKDDIRVSPNAASMGGSQVFLDANTVHKAENLIKSIIIASANDSCVAMAEHISGSVEGFVSLMNKKAKSLGLVNTNFTNCTGLPSPEQFSCAKDVATMMRELIKHPHFFTCSKIWMEDYTHPDGRVTQMTNTNKLSRFYEGCDGGKTGFTNESMHCLCATATRKGTRYIAVVIAAPDSKTRFGEVSKMLDYAFANYECKVFMDASQQQSIEVRGGKQKTVAVLPSHKLAVFGKKGSIEGEVAIELPLSIKAPIKQGDVIGIAYVKHGDKIVAKTDLIAAKTVESKSYGDCLKDLLKA